MADEHKTRGDRTRQAFEAMRSASAPFAGGQQLGSAFKGIEGSGARGLVWAMITTSMKIDMSVKAIGWRFGYWLFALAGLVMLAAWLWQLVAHGFPHQALVATPLIVAAAAAFYAIGWGSRWLWTGRTDHLFGRRRCTPPGWLDEARKNIASFLAFWDL